MNRKQRRAAAKRDRKPGAPSAAAPTPTSIATARSQTAQGRLSDAAKAHRAGRIQEAMAVYQDVLTAEPNNKVALNLLGAALTQLGDTPAGLELLKRAIEIDPTYAEATTNFGNCLYALERYQEAEAAFTKAIELGDRSATARSRLAKALAKLGRAEEANEQYRAALALAPDDADVLSDFAIATRKAGQPSEALAYARRAVAAAPNLARAHYQLGEANQALENVEEALAAYSRAIELQRAYPAAHSRAADLLVDQGRLNDAIDWLRRGLEATPDHAELLNNYGNVLTKLRRYDEARGAFERALAADPNLAEAHYNFGKSQADLLRFDEAIDHERTAIKLREDFVKANVQLGLLLLLTGKFEEGWEQYRWRKQAEDFAVDRSPYPQPEWDGADPAGKTLLVWGEQGIGDEAMFCGLLPELTQRGAKVVFECDPRIVPLIARSFPEVTVAPRTEPPGPARDDPSIDAHCPVADLAVHNRRTLDAFPPAAPYLKADPAKVATLREKYQTLADGRRLVGISWRTASLENAPERSIALSAWSPILNHSDCFFISLQYGDAAREVEALKAKYGHDLMIDPDIDTTNDLDTFAAMISALDLVVSIDNSTVHMSGALGVPTWVLLMHKPDWRWMLERTDSPWYRSIRLFRQREPGRWPPIIDEIGAELAKLAD